MSGTGRPTVAVIGAGTIGLGWITLFLGHGLDVRVNSRRPEARSIVLEGLCTFVPTLPGGADSDPEEFLERVTFEPDVARAVEGADVVQENAPEDLLLKQELYGRIGEAAPAHALLLSSTSTLLPDAMGERMKDSGRLVVGHPFNSPHVVPLVEVVGGERTDPDAVAEAVDFYRSVGRTPVVLRRPIARFVANRLQSALLRESIHLVREGVVTMEELDTVVTRSIGLRWSTIGPFHAFHLGGGEGGLRKWLGHLGVGLERSWAELGSPRMTEETIDALGSEAERLFGGTGYARLCLERDLRHRAVLDALAAVEAERGTVTGSGEPGSAS
ncbi:3-hydroxyacyl-CoA dehydrogenase NAD-binding domain-containing protein [Streptomyces sp. cmx-4-7]|uniref:3-hydroxyacyl-CoA dehydrogenase NAD-binding domain-containing protein n=1 Tax=Streptomyces sp. cmx-4-7 TaxID=2790939 RepID=UPI00397F7158